MKSNVWRCGWVGRLGLFAAAVSLVLTGCATTAISTAASANQASEEDEFSHLVAQLRSDLNRQLKREADRLPKTASAGQNAQRDTAFSDKARALFAPLSGTSLQMPVVGIHSGNLYNSWGDPRDGGRRPHRGIDIFAPRGTAVIAVTEGIISYIGDQPKGGHCLWLTTESGVSFYYAHLDRWAAGLYEGMEVQRGEILGYVGNTGNALTTPPHLHFGVNQNDEMVNPYPILTKATPVTRASVRTPLGAGYGTR